MSTIPSELLDAVRAWRDEHPMKMRVLAESVMTLSDMFTGRAPLRPGYLSKPSLRAAYLHYYLPVHYLKVRRVLDELASYAGPKRGPALDFGCGPGTAALALGEGDVDLLDIVDEAVEDARFLLKRAAPRVKARAVREPSRTYRTIVAAHVLAEMRDTRPLLRLLDEALAPDGHLVVVEPAMREPTRRLMEWRDTLVAQGFRVAAPCLGIAACPMRADEGMWCHQDVPWNRPAIIDELDRRTGLSKESLKYSYLVVTRAGRTLSDATAADWRVVSDHHRAKGRSWAFLCGRAGPMCRCEMLTRHRAPERRDFERARRGDLLSVAPPIAGAAVRLDESHRVDRRGS